MQLDHGSSVLYSRSIISLWEELCVKPIRLSSVSAQMGDVFQQEQLQGKRQDICDEQNYAWEEKRDTRQREMSENLFFGSQMYKAHEGNFLDSLGRC